MKWLAWAALFLLSACAPHITRPFNPNPALPLLTVVAPFDRTWDAASRWFSEQELRITMSDPKSGFISAEGTGSLNRQESGILYADCGTRNGKTLNADRTTFRILVAGNADSSVLAVTVMYVDSGDGAARPLFVCVSTGKGERDLRAYVKQRAESGR